MTLPLVCLHGVDSSYSCRVCGDLSAYPGRMKLVCQWCLSPFKEVAVKATDPAAGESSHGNCSNCCLWCGKPTDPGTNTCARCGAQFKSAMEARP